MGCGASKVPIAPALAEQRLGRTSLSEEPGRSSAESSGAAALKKKGVSFRKRNSFSEAPPEWPTQRKNVDVTPTSRGDDSSSTQFNPTSFENRVVNALLSRECDASTADSLAGDRPGTRDNSFNRGRIYDSVLEDVLSRSFGESGGARSGAPTPTRLRSPMSGTSRTGPDPERWNRGTGDGDGDGASEGGSVGGGSVGGSRAPSFNRGSGSANDVKSWQRQLQQPRKKARSRRSSREHQTAEEEAQSSSTGSTRRPPCQQSASVSRAGQLLVSEVEREVHGESRGETSCSSRTGAGTDEWPPNQSPYAAAHTPRTPRTRCAALWPRVSSPQPYVVLVVSPLGHATPDLVVAERSLSDRSFSALLSPMSVRSGSRGGSSFRSRDGRQRDSSRLWAMTRRRKSNTTNSVYTLSDARGTVLHPASRAGDVDEVLFSLACYMHDRLVSGEQHLRVQQEQGLPLPPSFCDDGGGLPAMYHNSDYSAQCLVVALVYIERLFVQGRVPPLRGNWKRVLFTALVLAAKVWDDQGSSNGEFAKAIAIFSVQQVNRMESRFLELIQYNVTVTRKLYTTCYFELRELCEQEEESFPLRPLAISEVDELEDRSALFTKYTRARSKSMYATQGHPSLAANAVMAATSAGVFARGAIYHDPTGPRTPRDRYVTH